MRNERRDQWVFNGAAIGGKRWREGFFGGKRRLLGLEVKARAMTEKKKRVGEIWSSCTLDP